MPKGFADKLKSSVGHRSKFGRRCLDGRRKKWIETVLGTVNRLTDDSRRRGLRTGPRAHVNDDKADHSDQQSQAN